MDVLRVESLDGCSEPGDTRLKDNTLSLSLSRNGVQKQCRLQTDELFSTGEESDLKWYLEDYAANEPFEVSRATSAAKSIQLYGRKLSTVLARTGLVARGSNLTIEVELKNSSARSSPFLQRVHWEILTNTLSWPKDTRPASVDVHRVFSITGLPTRHLPPDQLGTLNILIVTCRPRGSKDIDSQLVTGPLVDLVSQLSARLAVPATVRILRPSTWTSFRQHLTEVAYGHYQLVHFDMHGVISTDSGGGKRANLSFCKPNARNPIRQSPDPRTGHEIAQVLRRAGVKNVVLNACESASGTWGGKESNLAQTMIENGISFVLAMAFKVLEAAVETFMKEFYMRLLLDCLDISQAVDCARQTMLQVHERRALFHREVSVQDYLTPVVYRRSPWSPLKLIPTERAKTLAPSTALKEGTILEEERPLLLGRDAQISDLELLVNALTSKQILLHGEAGCGKTALLTYLCWWWAETKFVEKVIYLDMRELPMPSTRFSLHTLLCKVRRGGGLMGETADGSDCIAFLKRERCVVILDGLDGEGYSIPEGERQRLETFISKASLGKTFFVLSMRNQFTAEATKFFDVETTAVYHLPNLSVRMAVMFAMQISPAVDSPQTGYLQGKDHLQYLERVVILLNQNPLALKLIFSCVGAVDQPKLLFWSLLAGQVTFDPETFENSHCIQCMSRSISLFSLQAAISDDQIASIYGPTSLSLFWNVFPADLHEYYWFVIAQMLKDPDQGVYKSDPPLSAFFVDEYREHVLGSMENLRYQQSFSKLINFFRGAGMLQDASFQDAAGHWKPAYHLCSVATICLKAQATTHLTVEALTMLNSAYVKFCTLQRWKYWQDTTQDLVGVSWGRTKQHKDHLTNWVVSAALLSFNGDIAAEKEKYKESFSDSLLRYLSYRNWVDLRDAEIGNFLAKIQLLRLVAYATTCTKDSITYALDRVGGIAKGFFEGRQVEAASAAKLFLTMVDDALSEGHEMAALTEARYIELRHAEASLEADAGHLSVAKELYERNLRMDPKLDPNHELYGGNRRIQYRNLQEWIGCVLDREPLATLTETGSDKSAKKQFISNYGPGKIWDVVNDHKEAIDLCLQMTVGELYSPVLEREQAVVRTFGNLTQLIIAESVMQTFSDPSYTMRSSDLVEMLQRSSPAYEHLPLSRSGGPQNLRGNPDQLVRDTITEVELMIRTQVGDYNGAKDVLSTQLLRETSSDRSTDPRKLGNIHLHLYEIALAQEDWPAAKQHLDERWRLEQGGDLILKRDFIYGYHIGGAQVCELIVESTKKQRQRQGLLIQAGRHYLQAVGTAREIQEIDGDKGKVGMEGLILGYQRLKELQSFVSWRSDDGEIVQGTITEIDEDATTHKNEDGEDGGDDDEFEYDWSDRNLIGDDQDQPPLTEDERTILRSHFDQGKYCQKVMDDLDETLKKHEPLVQFAKKLLATFKEEEDAKDNNDKHLQ